MYFLIPYFKHTQNHQIKTDYHAFSTPCPKNVILFNIPIKLKIFRIIIQKCSFKQGNTSILLKYSSDIFGHICAIELMFPNFIQ